MFIEEDDGKIGVLAISHIILCHCSGVLSCIETLVGHVMFLKGLIAVAFESSELLQWL